jgi:hypothetical protein
LGKSKRPHACAMNREPRTAYEQCDAVRLACQATR